MVGNFTVGKEKYRESWAQVEPALAALGSCREKLLELADLDADAYATVSAAYALPRDDEENKQARTAAIQAALRVAAQVPIAVVEQAAEACQWLPALLSHGNPNLVSDVGVAADLLQSALRSAWLNVEVNLAGIRDEEYKETIRRQMQELIGQAENTAGEVWTTTVTRVTGEQ
jgi:formiminotetrahydrofolate cyclodeaminase